jgi:L-alanine-DL-glutamate epimerase-like enolase superfamily enzyme
MKFSRRNFLALTAAAGAVPSMPHLAAAATLTDGVLEKAASKPILQIQKLKDPLVIESIDLLRKGREHFLRIRSQDGVEGIAVDNGRMDVLHPILNRLVRPYFIGRDARELEEHLFGVYRHQDNYKFQGLALWCAVALVEFAILDLLGRRSGQSLGELRDTTPEEEIDYLKSLVDQTGAKAIKYRVGGRMSRNQDAMPGRTEKLIPLTRKAFGDKIAIQADANSSYDAPHAIEVGKRLEQINALFFEEPCPFDDFDSTKKVTEALTIPIALGEQEFSHARFQTMIRERVADIVQPDLFYYGGLIRSIRVARMAEAAGLPTTVHLSGGFGFVYSLHFASCVKNIGPWQEYKQGVETYGKWFDPPLRNVGGAISVPIGAGVGIANPKEVLKDAIVVPA